MALEAPPTPSARPLVSHKELLELGKLIKMYSVHPEALGAISTAPGDPEHIRRAMETGQSEFLIIPMDNIPEDKAAFVTDVLHRVRGKEPPRRSKPDGLMEKGYMLVHEPQAIAMLKSVLKSSYVSTEGTRSASL